MAISTDLFYTIETFLATGSLSGAERASKWIRAGVFVRSVFAVSATLTAMTTFLKAQTQPYPVVPRSEVVDDRFGTLVPDPYRGLEDLESPVTKTFIKTQNELTRVYLARVHSREAIRRRLTSAGPGLTEDAGRARRHSNRSHGEEGEAG
jgi:hypothetical protein